MIKNAKRTYRVVAGISAFVKIPKMKVILIIY